VLTFRVVLLEESDDRSREIRIAFDFFRSLGIDVLRFALHLPTGK
jgi:hypothetical protein